MKGRMPVVMESGELLFRPVAGLLMRILLLHGKMDKSRLVQLLHAKRVHYNLAPVKEEIVDGEIAFLEASKVVEHGSPYHLTPEGVMAAKELWGMYLSITAQRPAGE